MTKAKQRELNDHFFARLDLEREVLMMREELEKAKKHLPEYEKALAVAMREKTKALNRVKRGRELMTSMIKQMRLAGVSIRPDLANEIENWRNK